MCSVTAHVYRVQREPPMNTQLQLDAASGYLYLGMADDCLEELDQVEFLQRCSERFLVLRLAARIAKRQWIDALVAARKLKTDYPDCEVAYIAGSISLIEMKRYQEAVVFILQGPVSLRRKAIMHQQIAYCETRLGQSYAAELSLKTARQIDPELSLDSLHETASGHVTDLAFTH